MKLLSEWFTTNDNQHHNVKHSGPATEAPPASEDTIVLITGGYNRDDGFLSTSEVFPSTSGCNPPSLPEGRIYHTLFTTAEENTRVAVCGGSDGRDLLASCLVLDKETGTWDGSRLGSLPQPRSWNTAVTLKNIGNYLIGGYGHDYSARTTDYLAPESQDWVSGPQLPVGMRYGPCSVVISETSFLVVHWKDIREYQIDIENPTTDDNWQEATKWPQLQTARYYWPGCARIGRKIVIAGGISRSGSTTHRSTEIVDLETRTIQYAGDLNTARYHFHILTITTDGSERTFALGGYDGSSYLDSVEELNPDTLTWKTTPAKLAGKRDRFGAVALPKSLVCQAWGGLELWEDVFICFLFSHIGIWIWRRFFLNAKVL